MLLSRRFQWRRALTIVKPETFIRWHRQGFRLLWRWKSKPRGRPRLPAELQKLIATMADDNPTWAEERIAAELLLKLGIRTLPRTVRRYMPGDTRPRHGPSSQCWMTFVRIHAQGILACITNIGWKGLQHEHRTSQRRCFLRSTGSLVIGRTAKAGSTLTQN